MKGEELGPGTSIADAWYLRNSSLSSVEVAETVTDSIERPLGYPPTNASGKTTNSEPYAAAPAISLSALSTHCKNEK